MESLQTMADIKLPLSSDPRRRSQTIQEEKEWMESEGPIYHNLGRGKPQNFWKGCWVYFIKNGQVAGRSRAERVKPLEELLSDPELYTYTGEESPAKLKSHHVVCESMEIASHPIPHEGFQGFRYVRPEERRAFENAFRMRRE
ncbi:MAG: hypothetical protein U0790_12185 [Isosphaeraceae bacterium]